MKATITASGTLVVTPENELEAYSIGQWSRTNMAQWGSSLVSPPDMMTNCSEYPGAIDPILVPGATQR